MSYLESDDMASYLIVIESVFELQNCGPSSQPAVLSSSRMTKNISPWQEHVADSKHTRGIGLARDLSMSACSMHQSS